MIWNINYIFVLCLLSAIQFVCRAKTIKKAGASLRHPFDDDNNWQGLWFPHAPGETNKEKLQRTQSWTGSWFPYAPGEPHILKTEPSVFTTEKPTPKFKDSWQGKWFPQAPGEPHILKAEVAEKQNLVCDDGVNNLHVDYDPEDIRQNYNYLCFAANRSLFNPNLNKEALLTQHFLPSAFLPPAKCLNESIGYTHEPATCGSFRPLPAVYGTYKYLPPQRYIRNLAEGAIVLLYHPCAFQGQVAQLENIVRGCLYRHLVTPSQLLTPERPLAVLAWRHSLTMSVVDRELVGQFIRKYAKQGPLAIPILSRVVEKRESYKAALLTEARLVTDLDDSEVCGYLEQHM
ncbi:uncharacterized protein LOC6582207 [Drosophila mojavensis]|uniref:Uncharacterized protein n=1 Tax=Drosophila mojavensis TaxID=7230 RepID=B4KVE4_DROMO|nr:uncharacterized protein LOC6582207 [Drosophila mojavensis]EDW18387.1 uncharacterized protein Dmoj_GI12115 [Drosophila mojavensis]